MRPKANIRGVFLQKEGGNKPTPHQLVGLGKYCKLLQQGPWWSPSWKVFLVMKKPYKC